MSQKEIAQQMQLSQSTVEKHIAKGLLNTMLYMREQAQDESEHGQQSASIVRAVK